jgi:hypothetical protein
MYCIFIYPSCYHITDQINTLYTAGYAAAYWLRNYATSRKVADSRPDEMNACLQFT